MTSATFSGLACTKFPDCGGRWWTLATVSEFNPWRVPEANQTTASPPLHMAHRFISMALAVVMIWLALGLKIRNGENAPLGTLILVLVILQLGIGVLMVMTSLPIGLALAHNVIAGLILSTLGAVLATQIAMGRTHVR